VIVEKELPESVAAFVRSWVCDNLQWIYSKGGFLFPHPNNRHSHTPAHAVQDWFCKKRKQLSVIFPSRSFGRIVGYRHYLKLGKLKVNKVEPIYLWSSHLMKRLSGTLIQLFEKDIKFTQEMLSHDDIDVTLNHYVDQATIMENREQKVINKIFDVNFYDNINSESDHVVAVWQKLKN